MAWNPAALSLFAFTTAGILALLAVVGWRRGRRSAKTFAVLLAVVALWAVIYGVQLGFGAKTEQLLWQRLALATSGTVPPLFLLFALQYAGKRERLTWWVKGLLAGEAVVFAGLALTNPIHHLVWARTTFHPEALSPVLDLDLAGGYFAHILFAYLVVALGLWTILSVYFRSARMYRRQSALLLVGAMPAFASHILYTVKASPVAGLDLTPFVFTFTGVTYGLALFHFDLLERTPVAHQRAVELTGDGLLVVDADGVIVDGNRVAKRVYDIDRMGETPVSAVTGEADLGDLDGTTTTGLVDGSRRVYDLYVSELTIDPELHPGYAVVLRDVTDRDGYQQRLEVANRVLRHNLRNDMNVILGHADLLAERTTSTEQAELAEAISTTATDVVTLSEKVRQMVDIERTGQAESTVVDAVDILTPLVETFREEHPAVTVTGEFPDEASVAVVSKRALIIALRNVVGNAVEHNDASTLTVDIAVTTDGQQTQIRVADDGSGLPEIEQEILQSHTETPLQHSSGLGLWLTYWIVSTTGGDISVEASESAGTTITLTFPAQDSSTVAAATRLGRQYAPHDSP